MSSQWPPYQANRMSRPGPAISVNPLPARGPRRWPVVAGAIVLAVAVAVGIAVGVGWFANRGETAEAESSEMDLSALDTGDYDVEPRDFAGPVTMDEGRMLEAFNLSAAIASPPEVIPTLTTINGVPLPDPAAAATTVSANGDRVIEPVLKKHGMISGFVLQGFPKPLKEVRQAPATTILNIMVTSFPGARQAQNAAAEIDATDFAVNPANVAVPIIGYPEAHAHYAPGLPSIAVTMARKDMVVSLNVFDLPSRTLDLLSAAAQRVLDAQVPLMDAATSNPEAVLTMTPVDPDHMYSRLLVKGKPPPVGLEFARVAGNGVLICASAPVIQQALFGAAGVDRCAGTPGSQVMRARDEDAARALVPDLIEAERATNFERDLAAPQGVPDARCIEQKQEIWQDDADARFGCFVTHGRYVAWVSSDREKDALQRAAAQYALLVNNE